MCGILGVLGTTVEHLDATQQILPERLSRLQHRGPDGNVVVCMQGNFFGHHRLAIVGGESGRQPFVDEENKLVLVANGEIYNYRMLKDKISADGLNHRFQTKSDCEVIMALYRAYGHTFINQLDGQFSFLLYDGKKEMFLAARDPFGVTSFYIGRASIKHGGGIWVSSEMKAIKDECEEILVFPPGNYIYASIKTKLDSNLFVAYDNAPWIVSTAKIPQISTSFGDACKLIREALIKSVVKRIPEEVPFGLLLSGGLDSSLVASIVANRMKDKINTFSVSLVSEHQKKQLNVSLADIESDGVSFKDTDYAFNLAKYLGTNHQTIELTITEALDALPVVINFLETYDVTTIRASTPMYLLSKSISNQDLKVVLSGEGADEIFGGYLYFHKAPSTEQAANESIRVLSEMHMFDCLRANKSTLACGIEARVPFLDREFAQLAMSLPPEIRMSRGEDKNIEKYLLRQAFNTKDCGIHGERPFLPDYVLWRQKEQFSDGVGYMWIDELQRLAESKVSDSKWNARAEIFPIDTPKTREAFYYREIFEKLYPTRACQSTVKCWVPKLEWGCAEDPSGRAQSAHKAHKA